MASVLALLVVIPERLKTRVTSAILDALEAHFAMLQGTLRDHTTKLRRPFIRFFAC